MTTADQRRAWVLTRVLCDELTVHEAALFLGLSERSVWRLRARFAADGPGALVHGNRGRASGRRIDEATRAQVVALARTTYTGATLVDETGLAGAIESLQPMPGLSGCRQDPRCGHRV